MQLLPKHHIATRIVDVINNAKAEVHLVSPYLALWGHLEQAIEEARKRKVTVTLIYRADKQGEYKGLVEKLLDLGVRVGAVPNLHAKLYVNEREAVLTSMNLYDHSATTNEEIALFADEQALVGASIAWAKDLGTRTQWHKAPGFLSKFGSAVGSAVVSAVDSVLGGYCIRCSKGIPYDNKRPYCEECFASWNKYKNKDYAEKVCHSCGEPNKTSMARPVCKSCYAEQKA